MKKIKNIGLFLIAIAISFASCDKKYVEPDSSPVNFSIYYAYENGDFPIMRFLDTLELYAIMNTSQGYLSHQFTFEVPKVKTGMEYQVDIDDEDGWVEASAEDGLIFLNQLPENYNTEGLEESYFPYINSSLSYTTSDDVRLMYSNTPGRFKITITQTFPKKVYYTVREYDSDYSFNTIQHTSYADENGVETVSWSTEVPVFSPLTGEALAFSDAALTTSRDLMSEVSEDVDPSGIYSTINVNVGDVLYIAENETGTNQYSCSTSCSWAANMWNGTSYSSVDDASLITIVQTSEQKEYPYYPRSEQKITFNQSGYYMLRMTQGRWRKDIEGFYTERFFFPAYPESESVSTIPAASVVFHVQ
ncbi:MAG: hypothetical protein SNH55_02335 [Rikenellaceae bacterium]